MTEATKPTALFRVENDGGRSSQVSMRRREPASSVSWTPPMVTSPTRIFRRHGVTRQADLVRLVMPAARLPRPRRRK